MESEAKHNVENWSMDVTTVTNPLELEDLMERAAEGEYSLTAETFKEMIDQTPSIVESISGKRVHLRNSSDDTEKLDDEIKQDEEVRLKKIVSTGNFSVATELGKDKSKNLNNQVSEVPCSYTSQRETADLREQLEDMTKKFETIDMLMNNFARSKNTLDSQIQTLMKSHKVLQQSMNSNHTIIMDKINYLLENGLKVEAVTPTMNQINAQSLMDVKTKIVNDLTQTTVMNLSNEKSAKTITPKNKLKPID